MASREKHNAALEDDIATRNENKTLVVGDKSYADEEIRKSGADALVAALKTLGPVLKSTPIGANYRGFPVEAVPDDNSAEIRESGPVTFVMEKQPDGSLLYSKTERPIERHKIYLHDALQLKELSKSEAEKIHAKWNQY